MFSLLSSEETRDMIDTGELSPSSVLSIKLQAIPQRDVHVATHAAQAHVVNLRASNGIYVTYTRLLARDALRSLEH
jgi:hypothetical protein